MSQLREALVELLKAGEHDGPCTNQDDPYSPCELHVAASERRREQARVVLAADESEGER